MAALDRAAARKVTVISAPAGSGKTCLCAPRAGLPGEARAALEALDDERAGAGAIGNARAAIYLAEGDPAAALAAVADVLDGTAPVIGYRTEGRGDRALQRLICWPGTLIVHSVTSARRTRRRNGRRPWRSLTGWYCRSR